MDAHLLIINSIAAVLIIFVAWWFFGSQPAVELASETSITVLVKDGVYQPSYIQIPVGKEFILRFVRYDTAPCASTVQFSQLNLAYQLPIKTVTEIKLPPQAAGEIDFTCQMGMYRGKIIVA